MTEKVWIVSTNVGDGDEVKEVFATEDLANAYARRHDYDVEECTVRTELPEQRRVYVRSASVFPDGTVERHYSYGLTDDPQDEEAEVTHNYARSLCSWSDHCGHDVEARGTSREKVGELLDSLIKKAQKRQSGTCDVCGKSVPPWKTKVIA